uniref:Translocation protein SEC62 n=1 Tax=Rhabditophanes sp. KR3021 TaxID=114890 RepID=A0AC35TSJ7_9BILA
MGEGCCDHGSDQHSHGTPQMGKDEEAIAKLIRFDTPNKTAMFNQNEVQYFVGEKAVTTLINSKYGPNSKTPLFMTREDVAAYMQMFLEKGLFFRSVKTVLKKKEKKGTKVEETDAKTETEKTKKKVKLSVHHVQTFIDNKDTYVWNYNPTPLYKKIIGVGLLVGTIVVCLMPLWPEWMRTLIYYLAMVAIGFIGTLMGLAVLRSILFLVIFVVTFGKHRFWFLPNLTEDCGFFESFKPIYTYEYRGNEEAPKAVKKVKAKDSDAEESEKEDGSVSDVSESEKLIKKGEEEFVMVEDKQ